MGLNVIDASISIALIDDADALHAAAARVITSDPSTLVLPASAYAETMVGAHRQGHAAAVRDTIHGLGIAIGALTEEMAEEAARLRAGFPSLRLGDALVIATGRILGADQVLTGDRRWAPIWDRVRILHPDG